MTPIKAIDRSEDDSHSQLKKIISNRIKWKKDQFISFKMSLKRPINKKQLVFVQS
jgi:hypothetical protein